MENSTKIYVELLDEGTCVWRPVAAELQADGSFMISEQEVPEDEQWQFMPGERVVVEAQVQNEEEVLVAVKLVDYQLESNNITETPRDVTRRQRGNTGALKAHLTLPTRSVKPSRVGRHKQKE